MWTLAGAVTVRMGLNVAWPVRLVVGVSRCLPRLATVLPVSFVLFLHRPGRVCRVGTDLGGTRQARQHSHGLPTALLSGLSSIGHVIVLGERLACKASGGGSSPRVASSPRALPLCVLVTRSGR